jgi:hypothetical protein
MFTCAKLATLSVSKKASDSDVDIFQQCWPWLLGQKYNMQFFSMCYGAAQGTKANKYVF